MTEYEKSAIIGYWRSGAPIIQITWLTGFTYKTIEDTINEYQKQINHVTKS